MAERDQAQLERIRDARAEESEARHREQQTRRTDASAVADRILDPRLDRPEYAFIEILPWLQPAEESVSSITAWEGGPIEHALLLKSMRGEVEKARMEVINESEEELAKLSKDGDFESGTVKLVRYEVGVVEDLEVLTVGEQQKMAEYEREKGRRDFQIEQMTDGMSTAVQRVEFLEKRVRQLEMRKVALEQRAGDLTDEERERYKKALDLVIDEMNHRESMDFVRLRADEASRGLSDEEQAVLDNLVKEMVDGLNKKEEGRGDDFETLLPRAGSLTDKERELYESAGDNIVANYQQLDVAQRKMRELAKKLGVDEKWFDAYKAFKGIVSNINVTDQWVRAWHDVGAGSVDTFVQTRWTEYQKVSEMMAMCDIPGFGDAFMEAFRVLCQVGLNDEVVYDGESFNGEYKGKDEDKVYKPGEDNIYQQEKLTEEQMREFYEKVRKAVGARLKKKGVKVSDLFVRHATEQARMLAENSALSAWFLATRDRKSGEILYVVDPKSKTEVPTADFTSPAYQLANMARSGNGSGYADRQNDYIKMWATRAKYFGELAQTYPTGLPGLIPVLPDYLMTAWFKQDEIVEIADGTRNLKSVLMEKWDPIKKEYRGRPENSRWREFMYPLFRAGGLVDRYISQFVVGLKGFRGIVDEVEFFLRTPANLADFNKRAEAALGRGSDEYRRLKMNMVLALFYAAYEKYASPMKMHEQKTVAPDDTVTKSLTWISFEKDDLNRIFGRIGFMSQADIDFTWKHLERILPGEGGKAGKGMVKRSEVLPAFDRNTHVKSRKRKVVENI